MRSVDEALTESLFQNVLLCVRAQVDKARNRYTGIRALLDQRYKESGAGYVSSSTSSFLKGKQELLLIRGVKDLLWLQWLTQWTFTLHLRSSRPSAK